MKRVILYLLSAVILFSLTSCSCSRSTVSPTAPQPTAEPIRPLSATELLDLGEKFLLEMDYQQALVYFNKLIEIEPMNVRAYTGAAEAHMQLKEYDQAAAAYLNAIELEPDNSYIQWWLGLAYIVSGQYTEAEAFAEDLRRQENGYRVSDSIYVFALAAQNRFEELENRLEDPIFGMVDFPSFREEIYFASETEGSQSSGKVIGVYSCDNLGYMRGDGRSVHEASNQEFLYIGDYADGKMTGQGVGIYSYRYNIDESVFRYIYYIYIGDYVDGMRSGQGTWFYPTSTDSHTFFYKGEWENDKPNGMGEVVEHHIRQGMYVNGLEDGEMVETYLGTSSWACTLPHTYSTSMGKRQDSIVECDHGNLGSMLGNYDYGTNIGYGVEPWGMTG